CKLKQSLEGLPMRALQFMVADAHEQLADIHRALARSTGVNPSPCALESLDHAVCGTEECLWIELSYPAGILFIQEPRLTKNQTKEECDKDPKLQGLTEDDGTIVYYLADYDSQVIVAKWKPSFDAPARGSQGSALLRLRGGGADSDEEGSDWEDLVGSLEDSEPGKVEVITVTNWSDAIDREWEFFEPMEYIHMAAKQAWTKAKSSRGQRRW
ncbi:hypothetical protein K474DRAFT_1677842, partial [Panus rudis PR-1116 ss-1]